MDGSPMNLQGVACSQQGWNQHEALRESNEKHHVSLNMKVALICMQQDQCEPAHEKGNSNACAVCCI